MVPRILLIDDDGDDREFFCEALECSTIQAVCHTAPEGRKGLNQLEKKEIEIPDLIFLDINMPIMNGWQCLSILKQKEEYKHIPVIMYSTSSFPEDINKAQQLGALCFFSKPRGFNHLKTSLESVITHLVNGSLSSLPLNSPAFMVPSE